MTVMIRYLEERDFDAWHQLWMAYLRFYRADVTEETTTTTFQRLVRQQGDLVGLVATGDTPELLGFAHLVFHPSTWSTSRYCYLEDLFVSPAVRGTTAAADLIIATYHEADRQGADRTYWHTQVYNGAARSLYDRFAHPTSFVVYER